MEAKPVFNFEKTFFAKSVRNSKYITPYGRLGTDCINFRGLTNDVFEHEVKINLTKELKSSFYKPDEIREIFSKYPETSRRVGTLPSALAKKLGAVENLERLDTALSDFAKNFTAKNGDVTDDEVLSLSETLSKVLDESVTVSPVGGGKVGYGYKISTNEKDMFFKCFYDLSSRPSMEKAGHGNYAEIASALYSSQKAPDKFIKFYMGRFGEKNDGYMLTEFIEKKVSDKKEKFSFKELIPKFTTGDKNSGNEIQGKFIDFGMCDPTEYDKMSPLSYKILKSIMVALDDSSAKSIDKIVKQYKGQTEYEEALEKVEDIILKEFKKHTSEFSSRKDLFEALGLDYKPQIDKLVAQMKFELPENIEEIAQCYGMNVSDIEVLRKSNYDKFARTYLNK